MKTAAIIPAYNEAARIGRVLAVVTGISELAEVIVVDDGSADGTADAAGRFAGARVLRLEQNQGKGGAMLAGFQATDAPVVLFLDADLVGLQAEHVRRIIAPVRADEADMAIGVFRGGRASTDWAQILVPYISGQRALRRAVFETLPDPAQVRSGIELLLTHHARVRNFRVQQVVIEGVTHTMKEEKLGLARGIVARGRMYFEIAKVVLNGRKH